MHLSTGRLPDESSLGGDGGEVRSRAVGATGVPTCARPLLILRRGHGSLLQSLYDFLCGVRLPIRDDTELLDSEYADDMALYV